MIGFGRCRRSSKETTSLTLPIADKEKNREYQRLWARSHRRTDAEAFEMRRVWRRRYWRTLTADERHRIQSRKKQITKWKIGLLSADQQRVIKDLDNARRRYRRSGDNIAACNVSREARRLTKQWLADVSIPAMPPRQIPTKGVAYGIPRHILAKELERFGATLKTASVSAIAIAELFWLHKELRLMAKGK